MPSPQAVARRRIGVRRIFPASGNSPGHGPAPRHRGFRPPNSINSGSVVRKKTRWKTQSARLGAQAMIEEAFSSSRCYRYPFVNRTYISGGHNSQRKTAVLVYWAHRGDGGSGRCRPANDALGLRSQPSGQLQFAAVASCIRMAA